ncbi:hypothetical protein [Methylocystis heyeri]|uniref:Uncharacterized protein n=1 Tax=Methylocystis heyeri TaxID=391905 RepID=A0A6B8KHT8_9HYPH|nr:hypothetical protein [Methylocystis heyeri]QGM46581.1 hypothetical protein H2LOC_013235 [Methylocystis heyeri]
MFDALITIVTALFLTRFWSGWRYGFFDWFCAAAAVAGAFAAPPLLEALAPEAASLGVFGAESGGALLGCLLYDALASARR